MISAQLNGSRLDVVFEDPDSRNSFSVKAARELGAILSQHEFKALVFSARGRVFCSGGNLSDYAGMKAPEEGIRVNREITSVLDQLAKLPALTIACVEGDCFGGGLELLSAFDLVYSAPHVYYGFWQRRIGLTFGWGGGARLEKRLGAKRLVSEALMAGSFAAGEALDLGLIDFVAPEAQVRAKAEAEAGRLLSLPQAPVGPLKAWAPESEQAIFETLWWNDEHRAVLAVRK